MDKVIVFVEPNHKLHVEQYAVLQRFVNERGISIENVHYITAIPEHVWDTNDQDSLINRYWRDFTKGNKDYHFIFACNNPYLMAKFAYLSGKVDEQIDAADIENENTITVWFFKNDGVRKWKLAKIF